MTDETIFAAALEQATPAERAAYLASVCADNPEQRARIERLLAAHDKASGFLTRPAIGPADPSAVTSAHDDDGPVRLADSLLAFLEPSTRPDSLGRLGHYEVLELLGRGGFGIVLRAFDESLHRIVALKVLSPEMAATSPARKRFLREARASAPIRHENVVQVYAIEETPLPYIVMEFIPGRSLQDYLDGTGPLDVSDVLRIGAQIARGLAAAHELGLVHRDIKPANILLEGGMDRRAKLTDFGLARAADDASLTASGTVAGTPLYMAPEQARGEHLDYRADLFSLGSVFYTMCSGHPPFRANSSLAVLKRVCDDTPRPIQEIIPETPPWLCNIISKLHAKNPDERFQSAEEVADLLTRYAVSPPLAEAATKAKAVPIVPSHSRRRLVIAAGGLLVAAIGGIAAILTTRHDKPADPARPPKEIGDQRQSGGSHPTTSKNSGDGLRVANADPDRRAAPADYDHFAKGKWISVLPDAEEYNRLAAQKAHFGRVSQFKFADGILECRNSPNQYSGMRFPSVLGKDAIIRARVKKLSGFNVAMSLRHDAATTDIVSASFDGKGFFCIGRARNNAWKDLNTINLPARYDDYFEFAFAAIGKKLMLFADGKKVLEAEDDLTSESMIQADAAGLSVQAGTALFKDIQVQILDDFATPPEPAWVPLFNGKDLSGWKLHPKQAAAAWKVNADGILVGTNVGDAKASHLFSELGDYRDFYLSAECKISGGGDGGICFRCGYDVNRPRSGVWVQPQGYEAGISQGGPHKTGTLFGLEKGDGALTDAASDRIKPDQWFTLGVIARGNNIHVRIDDHTVVDYVDNARLYSSGHLALQAVGKSVVQFKSIEVRRLDGGDTKPPGK